MSIVFSNSATTGVNGIIQQIELECGFNPGDISGNTALLKQFTSEVNQTLDKYVSIAIQASGKWQFDDSNQTDYPIIKTNLVSGQRDYTFTTEGSANLILDIYKVAIYPTATATFYQSITPINELENETSILTENTITGTPYAYGKLANGIFLEPKPNYNATSGLKVFINRETTYFTVGDTTKKPGVPGVHHDYFYLRPSRNYARQKSLASIARLDAEVLKLEGSEEQEIQGEIAKYFSRREKDDRPVLSNESIIYQ